jgi:hypothetical protein
MMRARAKERMSDGGGDKKIEFNTFAKPDRGRKRRTARRVHGRHGTLL